LGKILGKKKRLPVRKQDRRIKTKRKTNFKQVFYLTTNYGSLFFVVMGVLIIS